MGHRLVANLETEIEDGIVELLIKEHASTIRPGLERLWSYYRNELEPVAVAGGRAYRLAQEAGLPARVVGSDALLDDRAAGRREVVIENDIAWRVHTMVDFMFGKPMRIVSTAREEEDRRRIERVLDAVWERSGGIALLQDMALLGHVYGFVDLVLRIDEVGLELAGAVLGGDADEDELVELAEFFRIEVIEPTRGIPVVDESDYRKLRGYVIHFERELNEVQVGLNGRGGAVRRRSTVTEVISAHGRRVMIDGEEVEESQSRLLGGELPVAHIQNISQPFRYPGLGEVEPLLPLQDELNTRLSDRASRVTMQSFKMMLVRGLDPGAPFPVGPGQVWQTDNLDASIEAFGGDADSPSERAHIQEVREAMDKISGVPPLAAGVVRARIGNLSSANALRVTLMGLISRTARKRVTYGRGIERISELILRAIDAAGVMEIGRVDRGLRLMWPDPLPVDIGEQVQAARAKFELGVPREQVLAELGVAPTDPGVT